MTADPGHVPFSVKDKTAIITGAGSGINFSFASLLLSRGCNVVIADLALRPEAQTLVSEHQGRAIFEPTDVRKWDDLAKMFDVAEQHFGGVDIVCPGAGIFEPHWSSFWHPPGSAAARDAVHGSDGDGVGHYATLDINLTHPIRTTQLAIAHWLGGAGGAAAASPARPKRIVHVSSIAGQVASLGTPLYSVSKHGVSALVRSLGPLDAALGIRVNAVAPGMIRTPLWTEHPEKLQMLDPARDAWIEPDEVAAAMLRCCEDPDVGGGYVMEVLKGVTRRVESRMDPGPSGPGSSVSNAAVMREEVFQWLAQEGWGKSK